MEARRRPELSGPRPSTTPRLVSLLPAATDMLLAMGATDRLVGISHLCRAPEETPDLPRVLSSTIDSDAWNMRHIHEEVRRRMREGEPLYVPNEELIASLRPDIILTQGLCPVCAAGPETVHDSNCRSKLITLSSRTLEGIAGDMITMGEAAGRAEAGRELARTFLERIDQVRNRTANTDRPRVAVVEWFDPIWVSGEWIVEMVEAAGGEYVPLKRGDASRAGSCGELAGADIIILAPCSMSIDRTMREISVLETMDDWCALGAVREGRVAVMDGETHFSAPGPRVAEGVELLAEALEILRSGTAPSEELTPWFSGLAAPTDP